MNWMVVVTPVHASGVVPQGRNTGNRLSSQPLDFPSLLRSSDVPDPEDAAWTLICEMGSRGVRRRVAALEGRRAKQAASSSRAVQRNDVDKEGNMEYAGLPDLLPALVCSTVCVLLSGAV